jgi:hypothetical protein
VAAAEPGNVDRGIVERGLAPQQFAPGFDRPLGFPDVFEEGDLTVVPAPAPGFEEFGEVFQSRFGKSQPARHDFAAPRHVGSICH